MPHCYIMTMKVYKGKEIRRETDFRLLSKLKEYDRSDSFPFKL